RIVARAIAGEESPYRLLVARLVARDRRHEAVGRVPGALDPVGDGVRVACLVDQPAQGDRGTAGLVVEPVPVARQQRDLAGDDAQPWPSGGAGGLRRVDGMVVEALQDGLVCPAQVEVDRTCSLLL